MKFRESETLELKKSSSELNAAIISIVSILNKHGIGELYFGIKNDGSVVGQNISDKTLRDISQATAENIEPKIYPEIKMVKIENKSCIYIKFSGDEKPYYAFGRAYIRVADEDRKLSAKEIENIILNKKLKDIKWDSQLSDKEISCVSEKTVEHFVKKANEVGRLDFKYESVEITLRKISLINNGRLSNAADVLFCSENPLEVQAAVFAGKDKLTFLDIKLIRGNIFDLLEESQLYIKNHIDWRVKFGKLEREEIPEIPMEAVREALVNSMCHKDYRVPKSNEIAIFRDRVEIYNPGAFPEGLTPEGFITGRERSVLRNPLIAQTLYYSKDIEKWGSGLKRIYEDCLDHHVKVEFQVLKTGFLVVFFRNNSASAVNGDKVNFVSGIEKALYKSKNDLKDEAREKSFVDSLQIPGDYQRWVREFHSTLPTDQLARKGEVILISLPQVYVPLETANPFHKSADEKRMKKGRELPTEDGHLEEGAQEGEELEEPVNIDIEELMGRVKCLLLEGKAGMGKTTLVKHLAYSLTHGIGPTALEGYLPVLVFLKDFWPVYQSEIKKQGPGITFESLLGQYFEKFRCPLTIETVMAFLAKDRVLFLLDGLDEVPETLRHNLVTLIHQFQFEYGQNLFLITGRPHGIQGKGMECFGKYHQRIKSLDEKKIRAFISKWFQAVSGQAKGLAELTAGDMITDIYLHEHAGVFTRNPLLLTALCIFYLVGGKRIPDQRADLYDRIVGNLLYRRFHDAQNSENVNRVREYLMLLAYTMHTRNIKSIDAGEAKEVLKEKYPKMEDESMQVYKKRIENLFNGIEPVVGFLNRLSSGDIEFSHLSFQEFMASKYILDMDIDYKNYLDDPWWEECLLLYTGLMNLEMKKRSNEIVNEMLHMKPQRLQLLGSRALRDFLNSKRDEAVVTTARKKLLTLIDSGISLEDRFEVGEILGALGDTRIQPPPMVCVEAGEFIRGSKESEVEQPVRQIFLDEFMIGKYPVTNEEFKAFMSDDGYKKKEFWTTKSWEWLKKKNVTEPLYWHDRKWNGANFPVVGVSWYETAAYAKWLSQTTGYRYALPTEAQWEKAARGTEGLVYPWGNEFEKNDCNYAESGLGRTSPVGMFPTDASPYGCMDMAGNVLEWCADWYGKDYYKKSPAKNPTGPSDGSNRVLRGGCWIGDASHCRAAFRGGNHPDARDAVVGFRLVRAL